MAVLKSLKDGSFGVVSLMQHIPVVRHLVSTPSLMSSVEQEFEMIEVTGSGDSYSQLVAIERSGSLYEERVLYMVKAIALEAVEFGALELFIGHPQEFRYEFFVDNIGYQGSVDVADYYGLLRLFGRETELEFQVDHFEIEALTLSLTSNNLNPVIHVGWRQRWIDESLVGNALPQ